MAEYYQITHSGNYHRETGLECQDFTAVKHIGANSVIAVVLDGCSGAVFGKLGAVTAGTAVTDYFTDCSEADIDSMDETDFGNIALCIARNSVFKQSKKTGIDVEEFSTTMLAVLVHKNKIFTAHIGDGFIAAVDRYGKTHILSESANIDDDLSRTYFITDRDALTHLVCRKFKRKYNNVFISTDGFEKAMSDGDYSYIKEAISNLSFADVKNNYELSHFLKGTIEASAPERLEDDLGIVWLVDLMKDKYVTKVKDDSFECTVVSSGRSSESWNLSSVKKRKKVITIKLKKI
ncbi:MAG: protein phosphatase 2C domain-containing protein [Ruminococcus sp.]